MGCDIQYVSISDFLKHTSMGAADLQRSLENLHIVASTWCTLKNLNILVDLRESELQHSPKEIQAFLDELLKIGMGLHNRIAFLYRPRLGFDSIGFLEFLSRKKGVRIKACVDWDEAIEFLSIQVPMTEAQVAS